MADITTSLQLWLKLNEGSGSTAVDSSGNSNNGAIQGSAPYVGGKVWPFALSINGSSQYVTVAGTTGLSNWSSQTVSFWFLVGGSMSQFARLIEKGANNEWTVAMDYSANDYKITVQVIGGAASLLTSTNSFNDSGWHHAAIVISSSYLVSLYIDGIFDKSAQSSAPGSKTNTIRVGAYGGAVSNMFNGYMNDVRIYTRELSPSDIVALFTLNSINGFSSMKAKPIAAMDDTSRIGTMRNKGISVMDDHGII